MPADRVAFRNLVSSHTTPKMRVTGVTRVTAPEINDLVGHTAIVTRVTRVTEGGEDRDGHKPCDPRDQVCVTGKSEQKQLLNSSGHTVTRSHSKSSWEKNSRTDEAASADPGDWLAHFEERAAIRDFEGGFDRADAERLAHDETVAALGPKPDAGM